MKFIKWTAILLGIIILNLFILECLLRVYGLHERLYEAQIDKELKSADKIYDFSPNMKSRLINLGLENKFDLDSPAKNNRIQYKKTENYNPYPPILYLFDSSYVLYSKDAKLKQLIVLSGEADATPSILVDKARDTQTGFGDYFVTYIFFIDGINNGFNVKKIKWYSWRGGSYNGFEEFWIIPMMIIELLFFIIFARLKKRKAGNG